jgi:hypothetical protein
MPKKAKDKRLTSNRAFQILARRVNYEHKRRIENVEERLVLLEDLHKLDYRTFHGRISRLEKMLGDRGIGDPDSMINETVTEAIKRSPESEAIRSLELNSMSTETAQKIEESKDQIPEGANE